MNKDTRRIALSGVMAALATAILMMGGVIPAATFVGPALAGVVLLPVLIEGGRRAALGTWVAVSALSLILCADKEAALLFAFMGWYPAAKWPLERKFPGRRSLSVKLVLWNLCAGPWRRSSSLCSRWSRSSPNTGRWAESCSSPL
ncbi:MAG: hypothetical protein IJH38_01300 [Clostridia bacterium]|nr:hypothetical protein [Clostridia bacterium]